MKKLIIIALALITAVSFGVMSASAEEKNIAAGKSYTYTGAYTDTNGVKQYPDAEGTKLTDGVKAVTAEDAGYSQPHWVGMNTNATDSKNSTNEIVINLGSKVEGITGFVLYSQNIVDAGIGEPTKVEIEISDNGSSFSKLGEAEKEQYLVLDEAAPEKGLYSYTLNTNGADAQYVKFVMTHSKPWAFVCEVEVLTGGTATGDPDTSSEAPDVSDETSVESSDVNTSDPVESDETSAPAASQADSTPESKAEEGTDNMVTYILIGVGAVAVIALVIYFVAKKKK